MPLNKPDRTDKMENPSPESRGQDEDERRRAADSDQASRVFVCFLAVPICVL